MMCSLPRSTTMGTKESRHRRVAARQLAGHLSGVPTGVRAQSKRESSASIALLPTNGCETVRRGLIGPLLPWETAHAGRFRRQLHRTEPALAFAANWRPAHGGRACTGRRLLPAGAAWPRSPGAGCPVAVSGTATVY